MKYRSYAKLLMLTNLQNLNWIKKKHDSPKSSFETNQSFGEIHIARSYFTSASVWVEGRVYSSGMAGRWPGVVSAASLITSLY